MTQTWLWIGFGVSVTILGGSIGLSLLYGKTGRRSQQASGS